MTLKLLIGSLKCLRRKLKEAPVVFVDDNGYSCPVTDVFIDVHNGGRVLIFGSKHPNETICKEPAYERHKSN